MGGHCLVSLLLLDFKEAKTSFEDLSRKMSKYNKYIYNSSEVNRPGRIFFLPFFFICKGCVPSGKSVKLWRTRWLWIKPRSKLDRTRSLSLFSLSLFFFSLFQTDKHVYSRLTSILMSLPMSFCSFLLLPSSIVLHSPPLYLIPSSILFLFSVSRSVPLAFFLLGWTENFSHHGNKTA